MYIELKENVPAEEMAHQVYEEMKTLDPDIANLEWFSETCPLEVTVLSPGAFSRYVHQQQEAGADLAHLKPPHMNAPDAVIADLMRVHLEPASDELRDAYIVLRKQKIQLEIVNAELEKANAELEKANAELEKANAELLALDRRKSEFLSTVSHELRTPLTPIKSCLENVLGEMYGPVNEKQRTRLGIALVSVNDQARLVENLLDLVRIQEGKIALDLELESVADIVQSIIQVFEYDAEEKGIGLRAELPSEDGLVTQLDRAKIKPILSNLVHNAIKFTPNTTTALCLISLIERDHERLFGSLSLTKASPKYE